MYQPDPAQIDTHWRTNDHRRMEPLLSAQELIAGAAAAGYSVTGHQLKRWRYTGLLPPSVRRGTSGRRGSMPAGYPAETLEQLVTICELHRKRRKLEEIGFELWWRGYAVDRLDVRGILRYYLPWPEDNDELLSQFRDRLQESGQVSPEVDDLDIAELAAQDALKRRRVPVIGSAGWRLAANDLHPLAALSLLMTFYLGGEPDLAQNMVQTEKKQLTPTDLLVRLLDLTPAVTKKLGGIGPWLKAPEATFQAMFEQARAVGFTGYASLHGIVEAASDEELIQARDDAHILVDRL
ncbi:MAG: hypothetical protein AAB289_16525, partial [Chloroflexota bacterium]